MSFRSRLSMLRASSNAPTASYSARVRIGSAVAMTGFPSLSRTGLPSCIFQPSSEGERRSLVTTLGVHLNRLRVTACPLAPPVFPPVFRPLTSDHQSRGDGIPSAFYSSAIALRVFPARSFDGSPIWARMMRSMTANGAGPHPGIASLAGARVQPPPSNGTGT